MNGNPSTQQKMKDLNALGIPAVNMVLLKLGAIQGALTVASADETATAMEISRLSMKEALLIEVIDQMWYAQFDKEG